MITAPTISGPTPLNVAFSGASSTGNISGYNWSYGDGDKGTGAAVSHTYAIAGSYAATLEVTDASGKSALATVTITAQPTVVIPQPPTAVISSSAAAGEAPLSVTFDGSQSTGNNTTIVSYDWDFGDGTKGTGATASHVYTVAGTYNTGLRVTDSLGLTDAESTPVIVTPATVINQVPVAAFSANPPQGPSPLTVAFDASASQDPDGTIVLYSWNFGDGSTGSGKTVQHTYVNEASYTATLLVTDDKGATSKAATKTIVAEKAKPEIILNYEIGELALTTEWVRVKFENTFINPAVFVSPPTNNDKEAVITRVRNLDKTGFDIRLQEWDYLDGKHQQETVSFLALEHGQTTLPDGTMIEVGSFNGSTKKKVVTFKQPFITNPVVLTTIISENEADAVIGRTNMVTTKSFSYLLQEQELTKTKHVDESVAYLAWSQGSGDYDTIHFAAAVPATTVSSALAIIMFPESFQAVPFLFIEQQTLNGSDPAAVRVRALAADKVELFLQEDQSRDTETSHVVETVGYLSLTSLLPPAEAGSTISFHWEFNTSMESTIKGFRIFNNEIALCDTTDPKAREITCNAALSESNTFQIKAIELNGAETTYSNSLLYNK